DPLVDLVRLGESVRIRRYRPGQGEPARPSDLAEAGDRLSSGDSVFRVARAHPRGVEGLGGDGRAAIADEQLVDHRRPEHARPVEADVVEGLIVPGAEDQRERVHIATLTLE